MKYISRILFISALALGLSACTDAIRVYDPVDESCAGDMTVNITAVVSGTTPATKSKVSGTENKVHTMQMVCFDANGLYLGIRNATVTSDDKTPDTGKIKGTVPQGTSRIHFIANRNLSIPLLSNVVGTPESEVMASEELSTIWNDDKHQEVCYWGYHKEANASAMESWLNPTSTQGSSEVYLIRDRAKVLLKYDPEGATVPVTKIEWLIHNGRERGYLAPAYTSWSNDGYHGYNTIEDPKTGSSTTYHISTAGINEYTNAGRYSLWISDTENDEDNFDTTYDSANGGNLFVPQFLFDDDNEEIDGLKAILRVTYTVDGSPKTVYHVLKLSDNNKVLYDVVRTNTYYINAKLLNPDVAYYETLEDAINGNEFMNADIEVDRSITDINNDQYTLQILLPTETTSIVFNTGGEQTMDFAFRMVTDVTVSGSTDPEDFEIKWEKSQSFCEEDLELTYNSTLKQFTITATVIEDNITDHLQGEWIVVRHKGSGLTRFIHVYVIDQFRYITEPTLTKVGDNYLLSFKIPPTDSDDPNDFVYPVGLYPIDVKFTTNTLNAYNTSQTGTNYGLFGVSIEDTSLLTNVENFEDGHNSPVSSTNYNSDRTHWYFQQEDNYWDFWYTYSIKNYEQTNEGIVNIYFQDVTDHIKYATVNEVGLFLNIKYFGKIYSIPVTTN